MLGIVFMVIGVIALAYGVLTVLGIINTDTRRDSEMDKKMLSEKTGISLGAIGQDSKE